MNNTTRNIIRSSSRSNNRNDYDYNPFIDKRSRLYRKCIATHRSDCTGYNAQGSGKGYFNTSICSGCPQNSFISCDGYVSELDPANPRYNQNDVIYYERSLIGGESNTSSVNTFQNGKRKYNTDRAGKEQKKKESSEHYALGFFAFCICVFVNNSAKGIIPVYLCSFIEFAISIFIYLKANTESHETNRALKRIAMGIAIGVAIFIFTYNIH